MSRFGALGGGKIKTLDHYVYERRPALQALETCGPRKCNLSKGSAQMEQTEQFEIFNCTTLQADNFYQLIANPCDGWKGGYVYV